MGQYAVVTRTEEKGPNRDTCCSRIQEVEGFIKRK